MNNPVQSQEEIHRELLRKATMRLRDQIRCKLLEVIEEALKDHGCDVDDYARREIEDALMSLRVRL